MTRARERGALGAAGFTLVELLVVMGIIGMLVGLLLPAVNRAIEVARTMATANIISNLSAGLTAFKNDFGIYPPSDNKHENTSGSKQFGYQNIAYYLMGPSSGKGGWGLPTADKKTGPFGEVKGTFGPYFTQESGAVTSCVYDAFKSPLRYIFYFRFEPNESDGNPAGLVGRFDVADNPIAAEGFASDANFRLLVQYRAPDNKYRWRREDYFLVSPGADRLYGYVTDADPPLPAQMTEGAFCDDVCNVSITVK